MNGGVAGEFGMEGGGKDVAILNEDGLAIVFGEDGDSLPDCFDDGSADEDHLEWFFGECGRTGEYIASELAAVAVAENGHIKELQGILRGILDMSGEENRSGAGAEDGVFFRELADGVEEAFFLEELQLSGGFPAGENQAIAGVEVGYGTHFDRVSAEFAKASGVGFEITLHSEDADFHGRGIRLALVEIICG